ncbi:MAG: hypothetical protein EAZ07_01560 [Cytophagales bacterium]|nr:MAG: hypothetical protein EAZ07_01560 [Cytophagales bacterium]
MIFKYVPSKAFIYCLETLLFTSVLLSSCIKKEKFDTIEVDDLKQGWGLPIIDSELSLKDIVGALEDPEGIIENKDSSYTFSYQDSLFVSKTAEELFKLKDENTSISLVLPSPVPPSIPAGQEVNNTITGSIPVNLADGAQLKSILFKSGQMTSVFSSSLRHSVVVTISIPNLKKNNLPYQHTFTTSFNGGSSTIAPPNNIDLNGYNLDLTNGGITTNTIGYTVSFKITGSGQSVSSTDKLDFKLSFANLKFKNMIGNLASSASLETYVGNTGIRIFDNTIEGNVFFERATVTIKSENSFGIPMRINIADMKVRTTDNRSILLTTTAQNLVLSNGNGVATISSPSISEIGTSKITTSVIDASNSNIKTVINPAPNELDYLFTPQFTGGSDQFVTDQSKLEVTVRVDIPIFGILEKYTLGDTLGIDKFPKRSDDNFVLDSVQFVFKTTNSLPVDTYTQLYFVDAQNKIIDSLLTNPNEFIKRPVINSAGKAIQATEQTTYVRMAGSRYDKIMGSADKLYIFSRILTSKDDKGVQQNIQLFSYNKLRIEICAFASGKAIIDPK